MYVYTYVYIYIDIYIYRLVDPAPRCSLLTKALTWCRVTLTDYDELVPLMERNIGHNNLEGAMEGTAMESHQVGLRVKSRKKGFFKGWLKDLGRIVPNNLPICY